MHGCVIKIRRRLKSRDFLSVSLAVSAIILFWGVVIIFNPGALREQLAPEGLGLALCLILIYQGIDPFFTSGGG